KSRTHMLKRLYKVGLSKRVESSDEEVLGKENASKQGRISNIDDDAEITLVITHFDADTGMFGVHDLNGDEVLVESEGVVKIVEERINVVEEVASISVAATTVSVVSEILTVTAADELTLAQALAELKSARPPTQGISFREPSEAATTITAAPKPPHDKGKGIMIEEPMVEKEKPIKKQEHMRINKELAFKLQPEEEEEVRLAREKAQQVKEANIAWDDVQAKIDADYHLAQRLQAQEQDEFTDAEKARLTKLVEESSKKAEAEIAHENDEDDVTIDATPLSTKSPTIMLKNFDREDLEVLWSIVKARFKKTEPVNYIDNFLLLNLNTMFEHHVEDNVWKNQQGLVKVLNWKLYDSCGMFNDVKLQVDYECEMAFELLRLVKKQLKEGYGRIVGIKSFLEVTAVKVCVTAANLKLVLFINFNEKYAK
ncbi:hypothetical protein Tco_0290156, partial [Tanacetum coccineum]